MRYKQIAGKLCAHGIDLWHIDCDDDADVRPILRGLMEGGINCLFSFEVDGCAHPAELLNEYGKDLQIMGRVDEVQLGNGPDALNAYLMRFHGLCDGIQDRVWWSVKPTGSVQSTVTDSVKSH